MLREALKHELELDETGPNAPDGGDLDVVGRFALEDLAFGRTAQSNVPKAPRFPPRTSDAGRVSGGPSGVTGSAPR